MPPSKKDKKARTDSLLRQNVRLARCRWRGELGGSNLPELRKLSSDPGLSIASGEILLIAGRWYVTSAGLLRLANKNNCKGIHSSAVVQLCDADSHRWVFRAIVHKSPTSKGFVGYGDADPSNVSPLVRGAEMRVAETRAVNRALRKAYGIGLCSVEELGWAPRRPEPDPPKPNGATTAGNNGHSNGQPRLRDRLCLLIRQHRLDAALVKAYAADYCGTPTLRDASRESIEAFINDLAERATKDREGLLCQLNSYSKPQEANP